MTTISWSWSGLYEHLTRDEKKNFLRVLRELRNLGFVKEDRNEWKQNDSQYSYEGDYEALKKDPELVKKIVALYREMLIAQLAIAERLKPLIAEEKIGKRFSIGGRTAFNIWVASMVGLNQEQLNHAKNAITETLGDEIDGKFPWSGKNHYHLTFTLHGTDSDYVIQASSYNKSVTRPLERARRKITNLVKPFAVQLEWMKVVAVKGKIAIAVGLRVR